MDDIQLTIGVGGRGVHEKCEPQARLAQGQVVRERKECIDSNSCSNSYN
jgi:hypothetical protein